MHHTAPRIFNTQLSYKPQANLVSSSREPDLEPRVHSLLHLCGVPYLYTVDRLTKYAIGLRLNSKSAAQLFVGLRKVLGIWKGFGIKPSILSFDREPAVNAIAAEIWSENKLKRIMVPPESHERLVERAIRPLKEHVLACCERYGCIAFPRIVVEGIFFGYITLQNYLPNGDTFPESPKPFISGERLDMIK
jgi:hypothetical protein